jgi:2-methylcitrate dehydratase PrpD
MNKQHVIPEVAVDASRKLARHVAELSYDKLPQAAVHAFRRALLDYLACAIAGSRLDAARAVFDYLQSWDRSAESCVVGTKARLAAPNAAFVNGTATHSLDFDDGMTRGSVHPAGAIFPALLAMAEKFGSNAEDFIVSGVAAYDVTLRIASTVHPHTSRRGFHNTPTAGVFGAAAGAARLMHMDAAATLNALGIAGSFSGGLRAYLQDGAEVKRLHPGKAARDGITCAELARRGITGASQVIEGRYGFINAVADSNADWECLTGGLGERYEICNVYFKPYPACRHFHAALDAVRAIRRRERFDLSHIAGVEIGLYEVGAAGHDHKRADNLLEAQMSAPVTTALALAFGDVTVPSFERDNLERADVRRLIEATEVYVDPECERLYPGRRSGVARIRLGDGRVLEERVLDPKGEGENPMSDDDLLRKFTGNCEAMIGADKVRAVLGAVQGLDRGSSLDAFYHW